jgi:ribose-phosphate pyrophosphokinase
MVLHLDPTFKPIDGIEIQYEHFTFSGGEPHIKINPDFDHAQGVSITHRLNSFNDLGLLCLAADALRRMDVKLNKLIVPYFPAARQDRVMVSGEPLSVKVYADIINALQFERVILFDVHSDVTAALVNNCHVISNHRFVQRVIERIGKEVVLVSPDGGALKKIHKLAQFLGYPEVVECSKSRNTQTGQLTNFHVYAEDLLGKTCLIVDDICDGGGTFVGLANELNKKNAGEIYLVVSHGIFSKGFDHMTSMKTIYTTDSIQTINHPSVVQIPLSDGLLL